MLVAVLPLREKLFTNPILKGPEDLLHSYTVGLQNWRLFSENHCIQIWTKLLPCEVCNWQTNQHHK